MRLRPFLVARVLTAIAVALLIGGIGSQLMKYVGDHDFVFGLVPMFDLDGEANVPALFSSVLLLLCCQCLSIIACMERRTGSPDWRQWATLSAGFLLMAVDESVAIHERFIEPVRAVTGVGPFGVFYYGWIVPASVLVLILGGVFFPFLRRLPRRTRTTVKWAAILYLGGALAVEMLGSAYVWHVGRDNLTYSLVTVTEEGLEMGGLIVFVYALQTYLRDRFGEVVIRFADD